MASPQVLALPKLYGKYVIDTDACDFQFNNVLLYKHEDKTLCPSDYWSRSPSKAMKNYTTTEKECLAIVSDFLNLHLYLDR